MKKELENTWGKVDEGMGEEGGVMKEVMKCGGGELCEAMRKIGGRKRGTFPLPSMEMMISWKK